MQRVAMDRQQHPSLAQLADLIVAGVQMAPEQLEGGDDHALEDVAVVVGQDAIDHPDALAVAVVDRRSFLEREVGDRGAEVLHPWGGRSPGPTRKPGRVGRGGTGGHSRWSWS